jgi:phosphonate degradation associated HDIG domain protein
MSGHSPDPAAVTARIADIFERRGGEEYLGEPVSMAEHMLQGAAEAERRGEPEEVIVAALLHDIGHFTSELGMFTMQDDFDRQHESAGAKFLAPWFPERVVDCVRHHVAAKRYLCATDAGYFGKLSAASVHSLNLQGGPMTAEEAEAFARNPYLDAILTVRRLDDGGKTEGAPVPDFAHFAPMVERCIARRLDVGPGSGN